METKGIRKSGKPASTAASKIINTKLPLVRANQNCDFHGYDADTLMKETAKLRKIITRRGTLEILIPLCCTTTSVRYIKFRNTMKGFSSKTLAKRLKELDESGILERQAYNEIPPRVEYRLTNKGQELVESVIHLLNWMKKWAEG
ncbi:MAG TPA: helix-turn-helix domain-containing protein [Nitrososphaeraceae archaeon]|jgi:DNA-binding HxlR family transcriptional regulator|nr:helix-turn-helix domain-containing protein [Nitrososphaeraceae archaeon]